MLTRARKGFTLLELIVVLVILGLLAAIAIPTYQRIISESEKTSVRETAKAFSRSVLALSSLNQAYDTNPWMFQVINTAAGELDGSVLINGGNALGTDLTANANGYGEVTVTVNGMSACANLPANNGGTFLIVDGAC